MSEKLRLKVTTGAAAGTELCVEDELVIGREVPGEGMIADDVEISRRHARVGRTPQDEWELEDLGSRNGTFLNGHRIEQRELLGAGDAIEVGATRLVVQVSAPESLPAPPAPPEPEPEAEPEIAPVPEPPALGDTLVGEAVTGEPAEPAEPEEPAVPAAPAELEESAEPAAPAEPTAPAVSLTIDLDPSAPEVVISLGTGSDRVRLVFEDGAWRLRPET